MKYCKNCGAKLGREDQKFCGTCGTKIEGHTQAEKAPKHICPRCGKEGYEPFHNWCEHCGFLNNALGQVPGSELPFADVKEESNAEVQRASPKSKLTVKEKIILLGVLPMFVLMLLRRSANVSIILLFVYVVLIVVAIVVDLRRFLKPKVATGIRKWSFIGAIALFLASAVNSVLPTEMERGKGALNNGHWEKALTYFSKAENSKEGQRLRDLAITYRQLDSARQYCRERNWSAAVSALSMVDQIPDVVSIVESAQRHLNESALRSCLAALKPIVSQPSSRRDSLVDFIISQPLFEQLLEAQGPNGPNIRWTLGILHSVQKYAAQIEDSIAFCQSIVDRNLNSLKNMLANHISFRHFAIKSGFPDDDGANTDYDALDLSNYSHVIVVDRANVVSQSMFARMNQALLVRYLGMKPYAQENNYSESIVSLPTYETTSDYSDPSVYASLIKNAQQKVRTFEAQREKTKADLQGAREQFLRQLQARLTSNKSDNP